MDDLRPATAELTRLVRGVRDDQLSAPTPCPDYTLGDLLDHVHGLATGFAMAARKEDMPPGSGPSGDASRLPADWRDGIEHRLTGLADAWADPGAWEGDTTIAGFTGPAGLVASIALNEVVVHAWDLSRASGQSLVVNADTLAGCAGCVAMLTSDEFAAARGQAGFAPPVAVPSDASALDRLVATNGRDPAGRLR